MKGLNTLTALLLAFALHSNSAVSAEIIRIQTGGPSVLPPLSKSKLGVARAAGYHRLPDSISYIGQIASRVFCSLISFDELTDNSRNNFALGSTSFSSDQVYVDPTAKLWLQSLIKRLGQNQQVIYLSLTGAPSPYQPALIQKPAAHPTPTNIPASANLVRQWTDLAMPHDSSVNWVIWNEPEHTLTGKNNSQAAKDMESIYREYSAYLLDRNAFDGIGLASFMKASLRNIEDLPSQSFLGYLIRNFKREPNPRIDFITLNNFHGKTSELIARLDADLKASGMDQPLVLNQFAPSVIGSHPELAGSIQAASHYLHALDRFVRTKQLASACMSFWVGTDRKALLRDTGNTMSPTLPFEALSFYQNMPLWRLATNHHPAQSDYSIIAARDPDRFSLLLLPRPLEPGDGLQAGKAGKTERQRVRRALRQQNRRDERGRQFDETRLQASPTISQLTFQLSSLSNTVLYIRRLVEGQRSPSQGQIRTDHAGRFTLSMTPDQIVMLTTGAPGQSRRLLPSLRTDLYIHRSAADLGWASVDAISDGFVLALPSQTAIAHASATYAANKISRSLNLQLSSPDGAHGLKNGLECTAAVLEGMKGHEVIAMARWGHPQAAAVIMASRAYMTNASPLPVINKWPAPDERGMIALPIPDIGQQISAVRLHLAASGCEPSTQIQMRVLS